MSSSIQEQIAAAFPFALTRQPASSGTSYPGIYGWSDALMTQGPGRADGVDNGAQMLQSTLKAASDALSQANRELTDLQAVQQDLLASTGRNTQALDANTQAKGQGGSSPLSALGDIAGGIFGQASILSPIVNGLMRLFGGGPSSPQPVFLPYVAPAQLQLQTTIRDAAPSLNGSSVPAQTAEGRSMPAPTVEIHVNAMDSKSILDHSDEIAHAVRQALLNSHSLGDVIAGL